MGWQLRQKILRITFSQSISSSRPLPKKANARKAHFNRLLRLGNRSKTSEPKLINERLIDAYSQMMREKKHFILVMMSRAQPDAPNLQGNNSKMAADAPFLDDLIGDVRFTGPSLLIAKADDLSSVCCFFHQKRALVV